MCLYKTGRIVRLMEIKELFPSPKMNLIINFTHVDSFSSLESFGIGGSGIAKLKRFFFLNEPLRDFAVRLSEISKIN